MEEFYLSNEEIEQINNEFENLQITKSNMKAVKESGNTIAQKIKELNYEWDGSGD